MAAGKTARRAYNGTYPKVPLRNQDWMSQGACHPTHPQAPDVELFFDPARTEEASAFCRTQCPVVAECAAFARAIGATSGIWGGVDMNTRKERRR